MKNTILYFEGAGMENTGAFDVNNCRIRTAFIDENGTRFYLEILKGAYVEESVYKKGKRKGEPKYIRHENKITVDFFHTITEDQDDCNKNRLKEIERANINLDYTKENILKIVNTYTNSNYTDIFIVPFLGGYNVFSKNIKTGINRYNYSNDFTYNQEATEKRRNIYYNTATEYFNEIYKKHVEENPKFAYLLPRYGAHSILKYDDNSITLRSHTYAELINDNERVKIFTL